VRLSEYERQLREYLESYITPKRKGRMKAVLAQRTRYIVCVLEDLYDPRNGSAVIRHCDALGIHELHAIENRNHFRTDKKVDMGSAQWLDIRVHGRSPEEQTSNDRTRESGLVPSCGVGALGALKNRGYRVVATSPIGHCLPENLDLRSGPVAIVFGGEKHGISARALEKADSTLRVPMVGFIESFNLSASAAIILYILSQRLRNEALPWELEDDDAERVMLEWACRTAPHAERLIRQFRSETD